MDDEKKYDPAPAADVAFAQQIQAEELRNIGRNVGSIANVARERGLLQPSVPRGPPPLLGAPLGAPMATRRLPVIAPPPIERVLPRDLAPVRVVRQVINPLRIREVLPDYMYHYLDYFSDARLRRLY